MVYTQVTWMFVVAIFLALFVAFGIGANDVANAFGPSVGAKALSMKQAVLVGAIMEFAGAILMGSGVATTIAKGIADISYYYDKPNILAYGMLCAMAAAGLWLMIATFWELPVSTTHSIVGAVVGMSMVAAGAGSVIWSKKTDDFPFLGGLTGIFLSWVFSPLIAGVFAIVLFFLIRLLVLRRKNAYERSVWLLPIFTFGTFYLVTWFIITKGGKQYNWDKTPDGKKAWISAITGGGTMLIALFVGIPFIKRKVRRDLEEEEKAAAAAAAAASGEVEEGKKGENSEEEVQAEETNNTPSTLQTFRKSRVWKSVSKSINTDIHKVIETDEAIHALHGNAEVFDHKAELAFKYLQVCTACANSFAHGSNDVANAVGPLAAIYNIWRSSSVSSKSTVPIWILAIGGGGIVFGLALYGYKIMRVLGVKMTKITNSRGFTVELCAAAVVILGSRFNLPLSTTQTMVGAVTGVGLLEGTGAFNYMILVKFFAGWVATIVIAAITSAVFTAQGIYAPSSYGADQIVQLTQYLNDSSVAIANQLNSTGLAVGNNTLVEQANEIMSQAAGLPNPVVNLWSPADVQAQAIAFLSNATDAAFFS